MKHELPAGLPHEGEIFDGKYRIGHVLGVGGMAAVLAATHLGFDELVAIKILLPDCSDDPAVVERFVQEGKTAVKIRNEHVVRMLDVGVFEGRPYLVMEHLEGKDLDQLLREGGPLPVAAAVDLLLQACEAIGEAHGHGIVHRDLKPANLFLTRRADGSPCVKLLDFGISKIPRRGLGVSSMLAPSTLPAIVMGTPHYMSPEQMMSAAAADARSDIWSLGATLYELLTAQVAFHGTSTAEICARVLQGTPTPIEELRAEVPADLRLVIARCLSREGARRYANVSELAQALAPFGSPSARVSAESIARMQEGGLEAPLSVASASDAGTMKPTAKAILATEPEPRRRVSGYLVGSILALAAVAAGVATVGGRIGALQAREVAVAAAAPAPPPPPLISAVPSASAPSALKAVVAHEATAPERVHPTAHSAARRATARGLSTAADAGDSAGPYDAP